MATPKEDQTTANWMKEVQKGYIRIGVLILLNKKPAHGYELMKEIKKRTHGFWNPTAGGVYPMLQDLEKSGYIKGTWQMDKNRKLKVYKITHRGDTILKQAIIKQNEISQNLALLFQDFAKNVLKVEKVQTKVPKIPSLFTPFLEEKHHSDQSLKELENQRKHMLLMARKVHAQLRQVEKQIEEAKKNN